MVDLRHSNQIPIRELVSTTRSHLFKTEIEQQSFLLR